MVTLLNALRRVSIIASDKTWGIRLILEKGSLAIEADNPEPMQKRLATEDVTIASLDLTIRVADIAGSRRHASRARSIVASARVARSTGRMAARAFSPVEWRQNREMHREIGCVSHNRTR